MFNQNYNPDVLSCLANLSSDEVFTPPRLVNEMLDLLPADIWTNPDAKFLDPVSKTGIYLREIAKRLMKGLETKIPDKQERINHIFKNQLFGIALTELTALLSRRSVYCSKTANGKYSICNSFTGEQGNIRYERIQHTWENGKCKYCGANQEAYDRDASLETYAYNFIHTEKTENIFNMKFDVVVGNPPYQMSDGSGKGAGAVPIYQKFVQQAKKLNPRYLTMIIPSRWFSGGRGLDDFRMEMLNDKRFTKLVDYFDSTECFPGVDISGGVCYFLWEKDNPKLPLIRTIRAGKESTMERPLLEKNCQSFIRFNEAITIFRKVSQLNEGKFDEKISSAKPFGLRTFFQGQLKPTEESIQIFTNKGLSYIDRKQITQNAHWIDKYKVYISYAYGERGPFPYLVLGKPFLGEPSTCCTETYLLIGPCDSEEECQNIISYIKTKFFRFLVLLKKNTQHATKSAYQFVPIQNFNEFWTDEKLYKKYNLKPKEINFIESMIRPMNGTSNTKSDE